MTLEDQITELENEIILIYKTIVAGNKVNNRIKLK